MRYFNLHATKSDEKDFKVKDTNLELVIDEADQAQERYDKESFKSKKHESNYRDAISILQKGLFIGYSVGSKEFLYYQKNIDKLIKLSETIKDQKDKQKYWSQHMTRKYL